MPSKRPRPVYWDTCVFIDFFQMTKDRYAACRHAHDLAVAGELAIVTSTVTLSELSRVHAEGVVDDEMSRKILDFMENDFVHLRPADRTVGEQAHQYAREQNLMPLDAIHVATAVLAGTEVLYTYDGIKKRRKGLIRHSGRFGTPPLEIMPPPTPPVAPRTLLSLLDSATADGDTSDHSPPALEGATGESSD